MNINDLILGAKFTVFLGKNGSGKSTLLRNLDSQPTFTTKYISPERGGMLQYNPGVEQSISRDQNYLTNDRRKNRTEQFRQQSAAQFRALEILVLRDIEKDPVKRNNFNYTFETIVQSINQLLNVIHIRRADTGFTIHADDGTKISEANVSSGESELIAQAIEVLTFSRQPGDNKILLLDEPDVHLHPDLQQRFVAFVEKQAIKAGFRAVIATHSTAIVAGFSSTADLQIAPITAKGQKDFAPFKRSVICEQILPIFGAHPLSSQFNRSPILLVEGEDDKRVIDQIVRSSGGRYLYSPCVVGTVDEMSKWEIWLSECLPSIYDDPQAFSLRDLDTSSAPELTDLGCVTRVRLNCYAIENLLLADCFLSEYGSNKDAILSQLKGWAQEKPDHPQCQDILRVCADFENRRTAKVKSIRNIILALLGITKPWEVALGQKLASHDFTSEPIPGSINEYLGCKAIETIFS